MKLFGFMSSLYKTIGQVLGLSIRLLFKKISILDSNTIDQIIQSFIIDKYYQIILVEVEVGGIKSIIIDFIDIIDKQMKIKGVKQWVLLAIL